MIAGRAFWRVTKLTKTQVKRIEDAASEALTALETLSNALADAGLHSTADRATGYRLSVADLAASVRRRYERENRD